MKISAIHLVFYLFICLLVSFGREIYILLSISPTVAVTLMLVSSITFCWLDISLRFKVRRILHDNYKIYLSITRLIIFGQLYLQYKINRLPVATSRKHR
jgi:hypothetical protein